MKITQWDDQSPTSLFDLTFLNNFDNKLLRLMLLETFIRTVPEMCLELKESFEKAEIRTMKDTAHKLKPNIEMMGIALLNDPIRNVEYWPWEESNSVLQRDVYLVIDILQLVVDEFKLIIAKS